LALSTNPYASSDTEAAPEVATDADTVVAGQTFYTRSVLYVDCSDITAPGDYNLEVKADLPSSFALLGTANQASALNATLPTVKVTVSEK
jgi:hypothetical protein